MTVKGPGTLKVNSENENILTIFLEGGLRLIEASRLETSNNGKIYVKEGGKIESLGSSISLLNNTDNDFAAITMEDGGSSGGSGGSGGGASETPTKVQYTTSNGEASISINNSKINEIISKAKDGEVVLDLQSARNTQAIKIPKNALNSFEKADLDLVVKLPEGNATIDNKALASILEQFTGSDDVKLELTQISSNNLSAAQEESVKNGVVSFVLNHLSLYIVGEDESKEETEVKWTNPFLDIKEDS